MPSEYPAQRFSDIVEAVDRIARFTAGMSLEDFAASEQTIYAVKYCLLVVSEAAAKLGDLAAVLCPSVPWRDVRGLGNRLRHDYDTIDTVRLWLLLDRDLPRLKRGCEHALRRLGAPGAGR